MNQILALINPKEVVLPSNKPDIFSKALFSSDVLWLTRFKKKKKKILDTIWDIRSVSEKLMSFCNQITWLILV